MEKTPKDIHPLLHAKEMVVAALKKEAYSVSAKRVLERSEKLGRKIHLEGLDNLPKKGPYILAANHYVRVKNREDMTGPQKMNDVFVQTGMLQRLVEIFTPEAKTLHLQGKDPRPEAKLPREKTLESMTKWAKEGAKFVPSNLIRKVFLGMFSYTKDLVGIPSDMHGMREVKERAEKHLIQEKGVIIIFPEGEVTQELHEAKKGTGYLSTNLNVPIVPVSMFEKDGTLQLIVGETIVPTPDMNAHDMTDVMMTKIASKMPVELRGVYKDAVDQKAQSKAGE